MMKHTILTLSLSATAGLGLLSCDSGSSKSADDTASACTSAVPYPGQNPGATNIDGTCFSNAILSCQFPSGVIQNKETATQGSSEPMSFTITTTTGTYPSSSFQASESGLKDGSYQTTLTNEEAGITILWKGTLANGANYVKESFTIKATKDVDIKRLQLVELKGTGFSIPGSVPGTPLVHEASRTFYGIEIPVAIANVTEDSATIGFDSQLPMKAGEEHTFTVVQGVYPEGQMRRGFLAYLERERALPYELMLQYNCWYDHGLMPTEENMLETVAAYGEELTKKRGIKLDSFVLDDGWDDYGLDLWQPHPQKFPKGFGKLAEAIRGIDSNFGIWISPLGGYSGANERLEHARKMGLVNQDDKSFDLSRPGYYKWYLDRCTELMQKDGVNFFKWDRAGDGVSPHFMSLLRLAGELREVNPKVFLSTTVGTWPSPFWLNHIDCIWRTGTSDVNWIGKGSNREQYITYRDDACYKMLVQKAPLFPLNSLMHHGIVLGTQFQGLRTSDKRTYAEGKAKEPDANDGDFLSDTTKNEVNFPVNNDLKKDIRILLGAGANLQELYLTPGMMNEQAWDDVAEAIRWSKQFADVTADTHWVGGEPGKLEVYGYASWRGDKGATLALRNPDDTAKRITLSAANFEPTSKGDIKLKASYGDQRVKELTIPAEGSVTIELEPFEVLVFDTPFDQ